MISTDAEFCFTERTFTLGCSIVINVGRPSPQGGEQLAIDRSARHAQPASLLVFDPMIRDDKAWCFRFGPVG